MSSHPKKILIFSHAYFPHFVGGAEIALKEITDRLSSSEFEFHLITLGSNELSEEKIGNIFVHRIRPFGNLGYSKIFHSISKYLYIFLAYYETKKLHKKYVFDHTWSLMATYGGFSAMFFKKKFPNIPFLLTLQEGDPIEYIMKRLGIFKSLYKEIFKCADKVQVISNYLGKFAKEMGFKGTPILVPNAVDIEVFGREYPADEIRTLRNKFVDENRMLLITTSRLVEKNGVEYVIRALPNIPNAVFLIIGKGELEESLRNIARNLGVESSVVFYGYVPQNKLPLFLKASNIFIRPSLSEGLGNSFLEAMTARIPVIATPVGGIPDFLQDGVTGVFCEPKNPQSIVEAVGRISDKNLSNAIVSNAFLMVKEKYDWNVIAQEIRKVLC